MSWDALKKLFSGGKQGMPAGGGFMGPMPDSWDQLAQHQGAVDRQMRQGQMLSQIGQQVGNSGAVGWLPALAQMFSGIAGNRLMTKADEKASDMIARQFKLQNEDAAKQAEAEARAEEAKYRRDLERKRGEAADPLLNPAKNQKKFVNGFWVDPNAGTVEQVPEYLDAQQRIRAAGRTNVTLNANGAPPTGFEKALDKKDADYYDSLRGAATTAAQTLDRLNIIKGISQSAQTGRVPEALAKAGQYFGSKAGADLQTFNATAQPMFLAMAEQMKGALSDKDREALQQTIPSFGNDPRANEVIIGILEKAAKNTQSTYAAADEFAQKNRGLRGFVPPQAINVNAPAVGQYQVGQIVELNGKRYRVIGGSPDDPDVEEVP